MFFKNENIENKFMIKAIEQAKKALASNEVPIGALIVASDGKTILAKAHNLVEKNKSQCYHAEILAINKACKKIGNWRLNGCTIYVTLEPCAMCMNLILLSKIEVLVFALRSKKFGYMVDNYNSFELYKSPILIKEGLCMQESLNLLKLFFKDKRVKSNE